MYLKVLRASSPFTHLVFSALIIFLGGTLFMLLSYLAGWALFGAGLSELEQIGQHLDIPRNLNLMKLFQTMQTLGLFILPPFVIAAFLAANPYRYLAIGQKPAAKMLLFSVAIVLFSSPTISWLVEFNEGLSLPTWLGGIEQWMRAAEESAAQVSEAFLRSDNLGLLGLNLVLVAVLPALGEELLFRGVIQKILKRWTGNAHAAIWISAIAFSAMHMQFFGFLPRMVLGAMFGYMLEWSGTLWAPIAAHFVNNAMVVIINYLYPEMATGASEIAGGAAGQTTYAIAVSLLAMAFLFRWLYINRVENTIQAEP